jgi:cupin superfamily acireductone dioxygenase involved in methionine salvage
MITNFGDFLNRKKEIIADYQNQINKLQNELSYLNSDNKENLST